MRECAHETACLDLLPQIEAEVEKLREGGTKALHEILLANFRRNFAALNQLNWSRAAPSRRRVEGLGLQAALTVPEPNTWREILSHWTPR
jgi:hypothetical protein